PCPVLQRAGGAALRSAKARAEFHYGALRRLRLCAGHPGLCGGHLPPAVRLGGVRPHRPVLRRAEHAGIRPKDQQVQRGADAFLWQDGSQDLPDGSPA
ncbi:unnamed protein product, partial [Effrenium voratum]